MDYSAQLQKFANGSATEEEKKEFNEWLDTLPNDRYRQVLDEYEALLLKEDVKEEYRQEWLDVLLEKLKTKKPAPVVPMYRRKIFRYVAAAVVVFLVSGLWFLVIRPKGSDPTIAVTPKDQDVQAPQLTRAMITLADGRRVAVDSLTTIEQGVVDVRRSDDGGIAYSQEPTAGSQELLYNTLTNPRGSRVVSLTLSDGTKVWLNAESSLRYPVAFVGDERKVEISGEAYFEVRSTSLTPNPSRSGGTSSPKGEGGRKIPFLVDANGVVTEVLGTHFNVNAYGDEAEIRVTLLEGSVRVTKASTPGVILKPGQQARSPIGDSRLTIDDNVDLDATMSWKNGNFTFNNADLHTIMRQVARWYNVEIEFEGTINERFYADISRDTNASKLFELLEATNAVWFKIEGKKVTVVPGKKKK